MTTETTRKPAPVQLLGPLTLTVDGVALRDLNEYRQASYAEQWPPAELVGPERLAYIKRQRQLADQAALGLAMFLNDQIARQRREPADE